MLELDRQSLRELANTVLTIEKPESHEKLVRWLSEKAVGTNENNLDSTGLDRLRDLLSAVQQTKSLDTFWSGFLSLIEKAAKSLDEAVRGSVADRKLRIDEAAESLISAVQTLKLISAPKSDTPST